MTSISQLIPYNQDQNIARQITQFSKDVMDRDGIAPKLNQIYKGTTVLHIACRQGLPKIVASLVFAGANIRTVDNSGNTALHYACRSWSILRSDQKIISLLSDHSTLITKNAKGEIPCVCMLRTGETGLDHEYDLLMRSMKLLEETSETPPDPTKKQTRLNRVFFDYICSIHKEAIRSAIHCSLSPNKISQIISINASQKTEERVTEEDHEESLSLTDDSGRTLLHKACQIGDMKNIIQMIGHGGAMDATDILGFTPLDYVLQSKARSLFSLEILEKKDILLSSFEKTPDPYEGIALDPNIFPLKTIFGEKTSPKIFISYYWERHAEATEYLHKYLESLRKELLALGASHVFLDITLCAEDDKGSWREFYGADKVIILETPYYRKQIQCGVIENFLFEFKFAMKKEEDTPGSVIVLWREHDTPELLKTLKVPAPQFPRYICHDTVFGGQLSIGHSIRKVVGQWKDSLKRKHDTATKNALEP